MFVKCQIVLILLHIWSIRNGFVQFNNKYNSTNYVKDIESEMFWLFNL